MSDLPDAVARAVKAMRWLVPADTAAVELATKYAEQIEAGIERGGQDATKALYLGPHLLNTLSALGGTPRGRKELDVKEQARGKLASVRDLRGQPAPTKRRKSSA